MVEDGGGEIVVELDIGVTIDSENDVNVVVGCVMVVTGNVVVKIIEPLPPISVGPEGSGAEMLDGELGLGLELGPRLGLGEKVSGDGGDGLENGVLVGIDEDGPGVFVVAHHWLWGRLGRIGMS